MKKDIYLLYSPIQFIEKDFKSGGPLCIKISGTESAYLAFSSKKLAIYAMEQKGIDDFYIINSKDLGTKNYPKLHINLNKALVFPSNEEFDLYFNDPNNFNYMKYIKLLPKNNKKKIVISSILVLLFILIISTGKLYQFKYKEEYQNISIAKNLQIGTLEKDVIQQLGIPFKVDSTDTKKILIYLSPSIYAENIYLSFDKKTNKLIGIKISDNKIK